MLKPFFSYYGSKWRSIPLYPRPVYNQIVEPFAGSATYSLYFPASHVRLVDMNGFICGVWDYLIHAKEAEIRALPLEFESTDDIDVPQEAKWLLGYWIGRCNSYPKKKPTPWRSRWSESARERIASQVQYIRHWEIEQGCYSQLDNPVATWFVDPPYSTRPGRKYTHNKVDYKHLADWCKERAGQIIVCEQAGAEWLPFTKLATVLSFRGRSEEVVFTA